MCGIKVAKLADLVTYMTRLQHLRE